MMRPINLHIDSNYNFQLVAHLVDRDDFLKDVGQIRKGLGLQDLIQYDEVLEYLKVLGEEAKVNKEGTGILDYTLADGIDKTIITAVKFVDAIKWLKKKYKKNSRFDMVFTYSILAGEVKNDALTGTAYIQYLDDEVLKTFKLDGQFQLAIVVTRETRIKEVQQIFSTDVQKLLKEWLPKPDTATNIRDSRGWYWRKKTMSWSELDNSIQNDGKNIKSETIRTAVRAYKKELSKKLYSSTPGG